MAKAGKLSSFLDVNGILGSEGAIYPVSDGFSTPH
jgi:hypothetical protein